MNSDLKLNLADFILPFQLGALPVRGRIFRMDKALEAILSSHDYPAPVSSLLAEAVLVTVLFSSLFKFEGVFSVQIHGNGSVRSILCDVNSEGDIRGCATYDKDKLKLGKQSKSLIGDGHMVFIVDQGEANRRYDGMVEIRNGSILETVQHYFNQSEQIPTGIRIALDLKKRRKKSFCRAGAIILQKLPDEQESTNFEDDWRRIMMLLESCKNEEILDLALPLENLLYRLFNEDGIIAYESKHIRQKCRCTREKIDKILNSMDKDERLELVENGIISATCEFCGTRFDFDP